MQKRRDRIMHRGMRHHPMRGDRTAARQQRGQGRLRRNSADTKPRPRRFCQSALLSNRGKSRRDATGFAPQQGLGRTRASDGGRRTMPQTTSPSRHLANRARRIRQTPHDSLSRRRRPIQHTAAHRSPHLRGRHIRLPAQQRRQVAGDHARRL
jgi:hypothetical protein